MRPLLNKTNKMYNNFITNSQDSVSLSERIERLINASQELKFLVGFFYFSGWQQVFEQLQKNKAVKLKILVGLDVDRYLRSIIEVGKTDESISNEQHFNEFIKSLGFAINAKEMDTQDFYQQVSFFVQLLRDERLVIRKTLKPNHAKLYIFKLFDNYQQTLNIKGGFITGSSNLTKAGLKGQQEFNVEIKDYGYETAELYFEELWEDKNSVPITEAPRGKEIIIDTIVNKSQAALITPYEAYALFLKTYIDLNEAKQLSPVVERLLDKAGYEKYAYQLDAVRQALKVIETYNGVIIADVVGLGKSVIASLIAKQLGKRGLVLCPPGLVGDKRSNTGWWMYLNQLELKNDWDVFSSGGLQELAEDFQQHGTDDYEVVIVDEVHRFRNQDTLDYEALSDICRGKQIILLTATPFNNAPADIFSLLKLFIAPGKSGITIDPNLQARFDAYNVRFKKLSNIIKNHNSEDTRAKERAEKDYYFLFGDAAPMPIDLSLVKTYANAMAREIKNVISPVLIRRNRIDLKTDYQYKKEVKNLSEIEDPKELFFELNEGQLQLYDRIINEFFHSEGRFKGAIYRPYEYDKKVKNDDRLSEKENRAMQQQRNLFDFMRRLLVKRFESSFGAFAKSIERFVKTHEMVLSFIEKSGKYILDRKMLESIYKEDDEADGFTLEAIALIIKEFEDRATHHRSPKHTKVYDVTKFNRKDDFLNDIKSDIALFKELKGLVDQHDLVNNDPKRVKVLEEIQKVLREKSKTKRKVILFTEYADTVLHLKSFFEEKLDGRVFFCDGRQQITKKIERTLNEEFNAQHTGERTDRYDLLITSDKLSEGFNLNRAGLIINYDIPWNPTRVIQRVGRINRIGTKVFDYLWIYNFFPTEQGADIVRSKTIAQNKMFLIHNALGEDAKIFDIDEEPTPSELFNKMRKNPDTYEVQNINTVIRNEFNKVKKNHPAIIEKINMLPARTKTAKLYGENNTAVLRKKGLALFAMVGKIKNGKSSIEEKTFEDVLELYKCDFNTKREELTKEFWSLYNEIKSMQPKYFGNTTGFSLEVKALNNLKTLKRAMPELVEEKKLGGFLETLINDIKDYKTLPTSSLRLLVVNDNANLTPKAANELIGNIIAIKRRLGSDYLELILKRAENLEEDIIIGVNNIQ